MNQNFKKILILIVVLFIFLGFKIIQAALYVEDKLSFQRSGDDMISLTRGDYTYTISVGEIDSNFVIKNTSSAVIFRIDASGNIYFPLGSIKDGISLSNITSFPDDCAEGQFIWGIDVDGSLKCSAL